MVPFRSRLKSQVSHLTSIAWVAVALLIRPSAVNAQYLTRPQIPWRTISTARFDIHFPAEMEVWTRRVAQQMESVADAVNDVVGNTPASRITVIVEDPSNVANGFALPFLESPVIFLWPTPPSPSPTFGSHRGWGEVLAIHEYGHIAHLTFPSRNPRERLLWKFLPVQISPVTRKSPAWVIEGYATVIEGQLTGSGRPYSSGRAAVLRQWALEGRFPTYAQLNGSGAFLGGNMRYLVGSAYLEWLQQRKGDSSLVHLWRRMSARVNRSFDDAFAGVFGAGPAEMYGAFTVDVMERALQVRDRLRDAAVVEGELVQRLSGATGDPAISPDGTRLAMVVRSLAGPSRLIVISTRPDPDSALRRARQRVLQLDSLDVAPFDSFPRPRRALATLRPFHGRSHEQPRWMPDGMHVLVSRDEPAPNGATRPDLFLWNTRTGGMRRVTHGAAIRQADPSPDGRSAAAVRCVAGTCGVVLVDIRTGTLRDLVAGTPDLVWHRPRYSPDGTGIVASYQTGGQWNVALIDAGTGTVTRVPADPGVSRHSPAFAQGGRALVVVSDRGGIPNLELVRLDSATNVAMTRVTGAVAAPDVNRADNSIWYLTLRSGGYDLRRLTMPDEPLAHPVVTIHGSAAPVAPPRTVAAGFDAGANAPVQVRNYGLGPRRWRLLPGGAGGPDGHTGTLMLANIDPIGRLSVVTQGAYSSAGSWQGGSIVAGLRRFRVALDGAAWYIEHEPSRANDHLAPVASDVHFGGAGVQARLSGEGSNSAYLLRATASAGQVVNDFMPNASRAAVAVESRARVSASAGGVSLSALAGLMVDVGATKGTSWQRSIASAALAVGTTRYGIRGEWLRGTVSKPGPGRIGRENEQFVLGGTANPLADPIFLASRIALPAVPAGFISGSDVQVYRASLLGMLWEPYFVWANDGDGFERLKRIGGIESTFGLTSLGFARVPGIRARAGASYSVDEPFANRPRAYISLTFTP
jgi:hypothetical protein